MDVSNIDMQRNRDGSGVTAIVAAIEKNKVLKQLILQNNQIHDMQVSLILGSRLRVCLSISFYIVGILCHVDCCIR